MNRNLRSCIVAALASLLAACVSIPSGPSVTSLPGAGKNFDQFRAEDLDCRQYATNAVGGTNPADAQTDSAIKSGAIGTAVGGLAGAAIGGHEGVGVGAGVGLLMGAMAGSAAAASSGYELQRRYDSAYVQCMYAKGNQVPMNASPRSAGARYRPYPAAAGADPYPQQTAQAVPPPPPGAPPPPPPGVGEPPNPAAAAADRIYIYPRNGQSEARTAGDRTECSRWASNQTGYDASRPNPGDPRRGDFHRAISACLEGRGYTVR